MVGTELLDAYDACAAQRHRRGELGRDAQRAMPVTVLCDASEAPWPSRASRMDRVTGYVKDCLTDSAKDWPSVPQTQA